MVLAAPQELPDRVARSLPAGPGVVAVSGGADSVALLRVLLTCAGAPLVVAHLNHQLRGADSDADEAFVQALCARMAASDNGLSLRTARIDVAAEARAAGDNLESTARRLRYGWLAEVARGAGASWVATGHTADDQAETVLHRLLRGSGLQGLRGIAARRPLAPGLELVRPLLSVTRSEIIDYLAALGQDFREDRSNDDPRFTRNRIRRDLLPKLAADYNPAIVEVLCRLSAQAAEVYAEQEAAARGLLAAAELPRAGALVILDAARLGAAPRHRVREVLRLVWGREGWPVDAMSYEHWERAAAVALGEVTAVDFPDGVRARRVGQVLQLAREGDRRNH